MAIRQAITTCAAFAALTFAVPAAASVVLPLQMTFQSGATFSGAVTLANDYSQVTAVAGVLHGYAYQGGYDGVSDDPISWIWHPGVNYSTAPSTFETFLMDGPADDYAAYSHWITLTYDYSRGFAFSNAGYGNNVDYVDDVGSAAPEPAGWALMILGFAAVGSGVRSARRRNQPHLA